MKFIQVARHINLNTERIISIQLGVTNLTLDFSHLTREVIIEWDDVGSKKQEIVEITESLDGYIESCFKEGCHNDNGMCSPSCVILEKHKQEMKINLDRKLDKFLNEIGTFIMHDN